MSVTVNVRIPKASVLPFDVLELCEYHEVEAEAERVEGISDVLVTLQLSNPHYEGSTVDLWGTPKELLALADAIRARVEALA